MLYPIENEIRQVKSLDGIWRFKKDNKMEQGFEEKWYEKPLTGFSDMPVPASYNDITTDKELRDHVGISPLGGLVDSFSTTLFYHKP